MEPGKNIVNGRQLPVTEKPVDQEMENKHIETAPQTEPLSNPDDTDLYTDATIANGVNDEEED